MKILAVRAFGELCGVNWSNRGSSEAANGRFRSLLIRNGGDQALFEQAARMLKEKRLMQRKETIADSALIAASSSAKNRERRRDSDARRCRRAANDNFYHEARIGVDRDSGPIRSVETCNPASAVFSYDFLQNTGVVLNTRTAIAKAMAVLVSNPTFDGGQ